MHVDINYFKKIDYVEWSFYIHAMNNKSANTREKILQTADQLIYQNGIHATGMDLLVKTSGVARKSIYRHFLNKDEVAAAALTERDERWMEWFMTECSKGETPEARILNMFKTLGAWFNSEGFHGCAFINTSGEIGDSDDPVRHIARIHKQKLLNYAQELSTHLNTKQPETLAKQLFILMEGAITTAHVLGDSNAANNARDIAKILLKQFSS